MLTVQDRLTDLVDRWEEARRRGEPVSTEVLCGGDPSLLGPLRAMIHALNAVDRVLATEHADDDDDDGDWPLVLNERYEIVGMLGRGGMGVVYRARDRSRAQFVALKTMRHVDPLTLYRFKREFRALVDVAHHPNLVTLYELVSDAGRWFLTMELIEGVNFLDHARRPGETSAPDHLRRALTQLAEGLNALHQAGRLHRDVKPSNVLVTPEGRVVLLDFGLVAEPGGGSDARGAGTVGYMAPEQAAGLAISPAADWYSVGVMLHEALTGRLPFPGRLRDAVAEQQRSGLRPLREIVPDVPDDLDRLCLALLDLDPSARPSGPEILRILSPPPAGTHEPRQLPTSGVALGSHLIGRERHLQVLEEAAASVRRGETRTVFIHGPSGVGKSALVQRFLAVLETQADPVIFAGRCFERESVPYKAVDDLIDGLSRYLCGLPQTEARALLPLDVYPLAQVFPVLRQSDAVARAPEHSYRVADPPELRRRAFAALRALLARLGRHALLVLWIDDLQWGDADGAAVLVDLLKPPDPPALLLLACYRSEGAEQNPVLQTLLGPGDGPGTVAHRHVLAVEALMPTDAEQLASEHLGPMGRAGRSLARTIAVESGGNPFFISELVRAALSDAPEPGDPTPSGRIALDDVLAARVVRLPADARRLLEVVAVAGRPLGQSVAVEAAGCRSQADTALVILASGRLTRGAGTLGSETVTIETYHDRVRESVVTRLPTDVLESHHRSLARALLASGRFDPEDLARHYLMAREPETAGPYFRLAADQAAQTLAFERAVALYRLALEHSRLDAEPRRQLRIALGNAQANAGLGADAAREYLAATTGTNDTEVLELRRRAAYHYFVSGHLDEGRETFVTVLKQVGLWLPATPAQALMALLIGRGRLKLRGLGAPRHAPPELSPFERARIDVSWSASIGLTMIDPIRGAYFQTRNLLLALRAGDPYRLARALAWEAAHVSTAGPRTRARVDLLLAKSEALAAEIDNAHALGLVTMVAGSAAYFQGRWADALRDSDRAERILRDRCTGVVWELVTAQSFALWSLFFLGRTAELNARLPGLLQEARGRGDLFAEASFTNFGGTLARLGTDNPDVAEAALRDVMARWSRREFVTQHFTSLAGHTMVDLYRGENRSAWDRLIASWPALNGSLLLHIEAIRIFMVHLRARVALAMARSVADPRPFLQSARRDARRLDREHAAWARPMASLIHAALLDLSGHPDGASATLASAADALDAFDMGLFAASARRRLGERVGGATGRAFIARSDAWMSNQQIVDPRRMAAVHVPGFADHSPA